MRLSFLFFAAVLLLPSFLLAQHSSGGGSGGSSSSGGSSHSSSSGGSSFSGGSSGTHGSASMHSSGSAHGSGATSSHAPNVHSANPTVSQRSDLKQPERNARTANAGQGMHQPVSQVRTQPEKRSFFSFLRHPLRRPEPKPVADLRRPVCFRGPCSACPTGTANTAGGCTGAVLVNRVRDACASWEVWSGGACLLHTHFLADCTSLRMAMEQQQQRMAAAELAQRTACGTSDPLNCSAAGEALRTEQTFYQSLQARYRRCQQQVVSYSPYGSGRSIFSPFEPGLLLDPPIGRLDY